MELLQDVLFLVSHHTVVEIEFLVLGLAKPDGNLDPGDPKLERGRMDRVATMANPAVEDCPGPLGPMQALLQQKCVAAMGG
jgi:hypothetical protein